MVHKRTVQRRRARVSSRCDCQLAICGFNIPPGDGERLVAIHLTFRALRFWLLRMYFSVYPYRQPLLYIIVKLVVYSHCLVEDMRVTRLVHCLRRVEEEKKIRRSFCCHVTQASFIKIDVAEASKLPLK